MYKRGNAPYSNIQSHCPFIISHMLAVFGLHLTYVEDKSPVFYKIAKNALKKVLASNSLIQFCFCNNVSWFAQALKHS